MYSPFTPLPKSLTLLLATLASLGALSGCERDPQDESIGVQIIGEWALVRQSGGIAGQTIDFPIDDSPAVIRFSDSGEYTYITTTRLNTDPPAFSRDTTTGDWFMTNVARRGDTLSFTFDNQLPPAFGNQDFRLVAQSELSTQVACCDQVDRVYRKR